MPIATRCLITAALLALSVPALAADRAETAAKLDLGVGLGVAYGLIGFNAEVGEGPVVGTGNLGWCDFWGWGLGARWYFAPPAGATQPHRGWRAGVQYGIVAFLNSEDDWFVPIHNRGAEGLCLSLGYRWDDGDAEIGVPFYSTPEGYDDMLNLPVQISFGIRLGGR